MKERILITGGAGFIGSHLTDFLVKKDFEIYALDRPNQNYKNLKQYTDGKEEFSKNEKLILFGKPIEIPTNISKLKIIECDIKNTPFLELLIKEIKPKFIFHFAAQPLVQRSWEDPVNTIETNVIGTINVFEPIKKFKVKTRVIIACTSAEYGTTTEIRRPLKETDPLLAVHPYGISKIATELLARQYFLNFGIDIINLRFFNQTGPRKIGDACADFISRIAKIELNISKPIIEVGNLNSYRDFTDIKDSLQAIWLAATKGTAGETYNICSSRKIQIREILNIALSLSKQKIEVKENTQQKLRRIDEDIIMGDNSKIKSELEWQPKISMKETLIRMLNYWLDYYKKDI